MYRDRASKSLKGLGKYISKFISNNAKYIWVLVISLPLGLISDNVLFHDKPLFNVLYLGQSFVIIFVGLFIYFLGGSIVKFIGKWLEAIFVKTLNKALMEFWNTQAKRLVAIMRKENQKNSNSGSGEIKEMSFDMNSVVMDTSTLIDGRIVGVISSGFLDNPIVVTQNVVDELQYFADKKDPISRRKGRRGLDAIKDIKKAVGKGGFKLIKLKTPLDKVDESLVVLCKKNKSKLATVDYNLNKAAQIASVCVLNVNKLANELKTNAVPGEVLNIDLKQKGKEKKQAIGYLNDGTMVVVKEGLSYIGQNKNVTVEKVLQTDAGRMIFAVLENGK